MPSHVEAIAKQFGSSQEETHERNLTIVSHGENVAIEEQDAGVSP
jgi:hypothetical protein